MIFNTWAYYLFFLLPSAILFQERQLRVVFVLMSLPPRHVHAFYDPRAWQEYQHHLHELLAKQNVPVVDASRWFPDANKFADALHLNEEGSKEFSQRLGTSCGNGNSFNSSGKNSECCWKFISIRLFCVFPDGIVSRK